MADGLRVQRDKLACVVRVLDGDEVVAELDPLDAQAFGETLAEAGADVEEPESRFAGTPSEDQAKLTEVGEDIQAKREAMLEAHLERQENPPEPGDVLNPNDPLDW